MNTGYELRFKTETKKRPLCEKILTREEVVKVKAAIENKTVYGIYFDNIHFEMQVGEKSSTSYDPMHYIFNHLDFHILYLENKVKYIYAMDDYDIAEDISKDKEIYVNFAYSVSWEDFEYKELYLGQQISILSSVSDSSEKVRGDNPMPHATNIVIFAWIVTYHRKYFTRYLSIPYVCIVVFMVIGAGVLRTRPYLGPFWVLELNSSLCKAISATCLLIQFFPSNSEF